MDRTIPRSTTFDSICRFLSALHGFQINARFKIFPKPNIFLIVPLRTLNEQTDKPVPPHISMGPTPF
jgi:hypothetical protein